MMRMAALLGVLGLGVATAAFGDAPSSSLRPMPRPDLATAARLPDPAPAVLPTSPRPKIRPTDLLAVAPPVLMEAAAVVPRPEKQGLFGFLRPEKRPEGLAGRKLASATVAPVAPGREGVVSRKGSVCGDPAIKGEVMAPITARVQGCGVANPVRVTSVAGIRLSQAATVDCDTARALKTWIERGLEPAYGQGKVVELQVAGHYVCRTRNHRPGAKISEHGRGRAIDISGFTFSNGRSVTVRQNFDRTMRKAHKAACGIFTTTLGPGSDGMHEDHLHFDVAERGSTYCR